MVLTNHQKTKFKPRRKFQREFMLTKIPAFSFSAI